MSHYQNNERANHDPEPAGMQVLADRPRASCATSAATRPAGRVGIMGAGATGIGIAGSLLAADIPVTLFEPVREALDMATAAMRSGYQQSVGAGELTAAQRDRRVALLAATVNVHHLKDCDVIVDTLAVDGDAREAVLRRLNEVARPDAVLMACTENGAVERIAALARYPANVMGFRLSEGAWRAWELVPGKATSRHALATATRLVASLGVAPEGALPPATSLS